VRRRRLHVLSLSVAVAMVLGACSASDATDTADTSDTTAVAAATASPTTLATGITPAADTTTTSEPESAEPSCDWDSGRLTATDTSDVPVSEGDDLPQAILGSWQHTHTRIDTAAGFEAVSPTTDIRYVLSPDQFLYCQDVEGATDKAERSAPLKLEGVEIVLPSPATGYAVTAWDDTTMIWLNHFDGSFYLLQRR
jgi:hypothetical protein